MLQARRNTFYYYYYYSAAAAAAAAGDSMGTFWGQSGDSMGTVWGQCGHGRKQTKQFSVLFPPSHYNILYLRYLRPEDGNGWKRLETDGNVSLIRGNESKRNGTITQS